MELHPFLVTEFGKKSLDLNSFQLDLLSKFDENLESTLIVAPTGIGKTLGTSVLIINDWLWNHFQKKKKNTKLTDLAIWITPLKALSRNLNGQLNRHWGYFWHEENFNQPIPTKSGIEDRTGDTSQSDRQRLKNKPPFILCTTPESLFSMSIQKGTRSWFQRIKYIVIDEIHHLAESKRGVLLSLVLEGIERITKQKIIRLGLSATVQDSDWLAKFLVGPKRECLVFHDQKYEKIPDITLAVRTKDSRSLMPAVGYGGAWLANGLANHVSMDKSIIVFTTTRSAAERAALGIKEIVAEELKTRIAAHHSSLGIEERFFVEQGLLHGFMKAVCATGSLELGIDVGHIDEVILVATPGSVSRALQRIGRARHNPLENPKGKIYATNFYDFMVAIGLIRQIKSKNLSPILIPQKPLEVLIQWIFGLAIQNPFTLPELKKLISNTFLFDSVTDEELDSCLTFCLYGGNSLKAYPEYQRLVETEEGLYQINSKRFKSLFFQNIGTIVEDDMIPVKSSRGRKIGFLEEGKATRLKAGDIISLGGKSYVVKEYKNNSVIVDRSNKAPTVPRWGKTRMPQSPEILNAIKEISLELASNGLLHDDWLSESHKVVISKFYELQTKITNQWPTPETITIEFYDLKAMPRYLHTSKLPFPYILVFYTFAGLQANHSISRLIAKRLEKHGIYQCRLATDEIAFGLFSTKEFPIEKKTWKEIIQTGDFKEEMDEIVEYSHALRIAFRSTSLVGQMILRTYYSEKKTGKQLRLSHDLLFDVLSKHERNHPLLEAARQQVKQEFMHIDYALEWLNENQNSTIEIQHPKTPSPLSLPILVHGWVDWSVSSEPIEAINSLYSQIMSQYEEEFGDLFDEQ